MSGFFNDTNRGRIDKMVQMLELIEKSAVSNRATPNDRQSLLAPLIAAIEEMCVGSTGPASEAAPAGAGAPSGASMAVPGQEKESALTDAERVDQLPHRRGFQAARWQDVRDMAEQASLKDLTTAMAIFLGRIDELFENTRKEPTT